MSAPRSPRRAVFVIAALLSAIAAHADDVGDILAQAKKQSAETAAPASAPPPGAPRAPAAGGSCTDGVRTAGDGIFCQSVADCRKFCSCACTFDQHKWKPDGKDDRSTTCPDAPKTGPGMLPPDSPDLALLSSVGFAFITYDPAEKAAAPALEGLKRLDVELAASTTRQAYGYTVRVVSCYRPQLADTEPECGYVLKGKYMLARTSDPVQRAYWEEKSDPNNLGLAWPGRTPHSAGYACDLVLVDKHGRDSFDASAGVDGAPHSSIDQRIASKMLDADVTNATVGGSRLTFEAWHYEWTTETRSRCKDPDCANNYWPVPGKPTR